MQSANSLANLLKGTDCLVVKCVLEGRLLNIQSSKVINPDQSSASDFSNIYNSKYKDSQYEFFSFTKDVDAENDGYTYFYHNDYIFNDKWHRDVGTAYMLTDNELQLFGSGNESSRGRLIFSKTKQDCGYEKNILSIMIHNIDTYGRQFYWCGRNLVLSSVEERDLMMSCEPTESSVKIIVNTIDSANTAW